MIIFIDDKKEKHQSCEISDDIFERLERNIDCSVLHTGYGYDVNEALDDFISKYNDAKAITDRAFKLIDLDIKQLQDQLKNKIPIDESMNVKAYIDKNTISIDQEYCERIACCKQLESYQNIKNLDTLNSLLDSGIGTNDIHYIDDKSTDYTVGKVFSVTNTGSVCFDKCVDFEKLGINIDNSILFIVGDMHSNVDYSTTIEKIKYFMLKKNA